MEQKDYMVSMLSVIYQNRMRLLYLGLVTLVVTAAITLTIPNYYKAETIFYPTSEDMMKPEKIFGGSTTDLRFYGTDLEMDRLLATAQSGAVLDHLIDEFNLSERYNIREGSRNWRSKLRKKLLSYYDVKKTRFDGISLSVEDVDPIVAAEMARSARKKISAQTAGILKSAQGEMIRTIEENVTNKERLLQQLRDSLQHLRQEFGIYNVETQSEQFSDMITRLESNLQKERIRFDRLSSNPRISRDTVIYLEANLMGMEEQYRYLMGTEGEESPTGLRRFNQGMGLVDMLENQVEKENAQLSYDKIRLKNYRAAYDSPYSAVFVIQEAIPPDEKSWPRRSLIVLGAVFIALFLGVLGLLLVESVDPKTIDRIRKK
nr:hypothetical protein [Saprospiraceae bacterium]